MATKPKYGLPLDGRVATKRDHDTEVNRVVSAVWDAAVVTQLGTPEANALLTEFQDLRDAILVARQFETLAELQSANIQGDIASVIVADRIYVRDDTDGAVASSDGKRWSSLDFRGRFDALQADMLQGSARVIVAYGDSTTDGLGTTDHTANPVDGSGNAIGSAPHAPANAWPAVCQGVIRPMTGNDAIGIRNAGYAGRRLYDGWAYANFNAAMAPYPNPHAVMVQFGINDIRDEAFTPAAFEAQLLLLCRRIARLGAFPIFVTPDEPSMSGRDGWLIGKVNAIYRSVAERIGVKVIDWGTAQNELAQCSDATDFRWGADQPDDTHGNDAWHRVKGAYIAACLYPHTLFVKDPITDVAPWSRYCKPKPGHTVAQITQNKFGGALVYDGGTYATDEFLIDLWVWSTGAARKMYWAAVDGNGFWSPRSLSGAPLIGWREYINPASQTVIAPGSGAVSAPDGVRDAEAMGFVARVPQGLSRWAFRAPRDNTANNVYVGYFSIREVAPVYAAAVPMFSSSPSLIIHDRDPGGDIPQVFGFGSDRQANLALTFDVQPGLGVALWSSRVYGGSVSRENNRKRGLFLNRHPDNRLMLFTAVYHANGSVIDTVQLGASAGSLTWEGPRRLRILAGVDGAGQYIQVYDGWLSNTPAISVTNALSNPPLPWGGTPGAVWQNADTVGVAALTIYGDI